MICVNPFPKSHKYEVAFWLWFVIIASNGTISVVGVAVNKAVGVWLMITVASSVSVQPFGEVTVNVYWPAFDGVIAVHT